jgi:hypothetical protein
MDIRAVKRHLIIEMLKSIQLLKKKTINICLATGGLEENIQSLCAG